MRIRKKFARRAKKQRPAIINIIMSTYNGQTFVKEQLESIADSSFQDWKLYIFDDGSSDKTADIVKQFAEKHPDKVVLTNNDTNLGSTKSFLNGVKYVLDNYDIPSNENDSYYMFSDQDDVWLKDKLIICLKALRKMERKHGSEVPALVFTDAILVNRELQYITSSFYRAGHLKSRHTDLSRLLMENKCIGCTMMFNRACASMIGEPDERVRYHDWWTALIAASFGHIKYINIPTLMYRQHSGNQVGQTGFSSYLAERTSSTSDVKERLLKTYEQAEAFYETYSKVLSDRKARLIRSFISLKNAGFFKKRMILVKNRFYKSGFLRNVGLMFYI